MATDVQAMPTEEVVYPTSDGQPMADNTRQFRWIVTIQGGLDAMFRDNPDVFVAGDRLWYPVKGEPRNRRAPDVMVVFGRPKGDRGAYLQWEEDGIAPQVVFEVMSPGNTHTEMAKKFQFYDDYGVEEYYLYDPDINELSGWLRSDNRLRVIDSTEGWISPRLGIRFEVHEDGLHIYRPDGQECVSYVELERQREQEYQRAERLAAYLRSMAIDPDRV